MSRAAVCCSCMLTAGAVAAPWLALAVRDCCACDAVCGRDGDPEWALELRRTDLRSFRAVFEERGGLAIMGPYRVPLYGSTGRRVELAVRGRSPRDGDEREYGCCAFEEYAACEGAEATVAEMGGMPAMSEWKITW